MSQDVKFKLGRHDESSFVEWFIIHAVAHHAPKDPEIKAVWDAIKADDDHFIRVKIDFKINGVEAPFEKILFSINEQLDRMIEEKAIELFRERCGDLLDELDEFRKNLRQRGSDLFPLARRDDD